MDLVTFSVDEMKNEFIDYVAHVLHSMNPYQLLAEAVMAVFIIYLIFAKSYKPTKPLTEKEVDELIEGWVPAPLYPALTPTDTQRDSEIPTVQSTGSTKMIINGKKCTNLMTTNFLGFVGHPALQEEAIEAVHKYGVGSCGPRGFYGTIDVHLKLEQRIARFLGAEDAVLYSSGYATATSVIPSFSKLGDIIVCDEGCSWSVQVGLQLAQSRVFYFKHNDMEHLESVMEKIKREFPEDKKPKFRKFLVIEGLYYNYGDIAPLPRILELKEKFFYRLIIDESASMGVLGKTGRGLCEHWGVPVPSVEMIIATLGNSFGSVGGFCVGSKQVADHQRLNSSGYVFSASSPPYLSASAIRAFNLLEENPQLMAKLSIKTRNFRENIRDIAGLKVCGEEVSPVIHLRLRNPTGSQEGDDNQLQAIVDKAMEVGSVAITRAKYTKLERKPPQPSIRICISATQEDDELHRACMAVKQAAAMVFNPPINTPATQQTQPAPKTKK